MSVCLIVSVEPERAILLDHFLRHYLPKVDRAVVFFQLDEAGVDSSGLQLVCNRSDVPFQEIVGPFDCQRIFLQMEEWAREHLDGGWIVPVDVDEFVARETDLRALALECEAGGWLWVKGRMIDRHAAGGRISELDPVLPLDIQFPLRSNITETIARGTTTKVVLARWPHIGMIHHYSKDERLNARSHPDTLALAHYKWHSDVIERLEKRVRVETKLKKHWVAEHGRMLSHLVENRRVDLLPHLLTSSEGIKGWFPFPDIYIEAVSHLPQGSHIIELGCFYGKSSCLLAEVALALDKDLRIDCIDVFRSGPICFESDQLSRPGSFVDEFCGNLRNASVLDKVNVVQLESEEASRVYEDGSLDFVMIDARHDYEAVTRNLNLWFPKLRAGCIIAGHDVTWEGERQAVEDFCQASGLVFCRDQDCWLIRK